jgi:hypothetical protein
MDLSLAVNPATAEDESSWMAATESSLDWLLSLSGRLQTQSNESEMKGKGKAVEDCVHWYCGKDGAEECLESATFLIRLLSFKRHGDVGLWRDRFDKCVPHFSVFMHQKLTINLLVD